MDATSLIVGFTAGTLLGCFFGAAWITFRISTGQDERFAPRVWPPSPSLGPGETPHPAARPRRGRTLRLS